jgi:hypothetical protein
MMKSKKGFWERPTQVYILDSDAPDLPDVSIAFSKCYWIFPHKSGGPPLVFCKMVTSPWFYMLANTASGNRCQHSVFATCPGWSVYQ